MTDYTRLVAAGLSMLAMLIAGCGGDDPISPTAPSPGTEAAVVPDPVGSADASGGQQANNTDKGDDDTTSDTDDDDDGGGKSDDDEDDDEETTGGKDDDDDDGGGKGDDDDGGDDDDDGGVGSRLICVGNVRDVQTTVPAAAANYTVAYDRFLTPGCASYVNNRYFGKDVPWISYSSAANDGRLITYTVAANTTTSVRTGNIWIIDIVNNNTPTGRTAITQRARNERPTVSIACDPAGACNGEETYTGQTVTLTATAADPDSHDTLHYEWAIDGPGVLGDGTGINTEASVVWRAGKAGTDTRITVTVVDRENPEASDKLEASATVTIRTVAPPDCSIALSGNLTDFGQGTGFPVGADVGQLYYALSRDSRCTDPVLRDFRTTASGWIRALSMDTSTDPDHPRENKDGWDHFIEFQVDANPTYAIRQADVWVAGSSERSTLRQQAATRPRPTCPTTAITHTRTTWRVGGRYYGSGFTQPWAKMGYGTPGGCRVNGLSLSQPGRVRVCGYNVADDAAQAACTAAPSAAAATRSTDPTVGAVHTVDGSPARSGSSSLWTRRRQAGRSVWRSARAAAGSTCTSATSTRAI